MTCRAAPQPGANRSLPRPGNLLNRGQGWHFDRPGRAVGRCQGVAPRPPCQQLLAPDRPRRSVGAGTSLGGEAGAEACINCLISASSSAAGKLPQAGNLALKRVGLVAPLPDPIRGVRSKVP